MFWLKEMECPSALISGVNFLGFGFKLMKIAGKGLLFTRSHCGGIRGL